MAEEKIGTCGSCDHEGLVETFPTKFGQGTIDLCEVCSCTLAGNAACYTTAYNDPSVMRLIAQCTNLILDAIKKGEV